MKLKSSTDIELEKAVSLRRKSNIIQKTSTSTSSIVSKGKGLQTHKYYSLKSQKKFRKNGYHAS